MEKKNRRQDFSIFSVRLKIRSSSRYHRFSSDYQLRLRDGVRNRLAGHHYFTVVPTIIRRLGRDVTTMGHDNPFTIRP